MPTIHVCGEDSKRWNLQRAQYTVRAPEIFSTLMPKIHHCQKIRLGAKFSNIECYVTSLNLSFFYKLGV